MPGAKMALRRAAEKGRYVRSPTEPPWQVSRDPRSWLAKDLRCKATSLSFAGDRCCHYGRVGSDSVGQLICRLRRDSGWSRRPSQAQECRAL